MKYFILGIIATLAVIYPATTKHMLNATVDVVHNAANSVLKEPTTKPAEPKGEGKKNAQ